MTDDWQTPTFYEYGLLQRYGIISRVGRPFAPPKAKVTRSNRVGRAISEYAIGTKCRRLPDASRQVASVELRVSQSQRITMTERQLNAL